MKMQLQKEILNVTGKILKAAVDSECGKRPPHCMGIMHQPKRPELKITNQK